MADFRAYSVGFCCASVCTSLSDEQATVRLNQEHPTGLASGWAVSTDEKFAGGQPNPCPCPDVAGHRHVLFNC